MPNDTATPAPAPTQPLTESQNHQPKKKKSRPKVHIQSPSHQAEEVRRLSDTELVYPDPEAAKRAFEDERSSNPLHRRAPTPYSRRRSGSVDSGRSSRSARSSRSQHSLPHSHLSEESDATLGPGPGINTSSIIDPWEPHFGSSRGIGAPGDAIEVIGLGRKEPRHRKYGSHLLKSALRTPISASNNVPRYEQDERRDRHRRHHSHTPVSRRAHDKPLPGRPASFFVPIESTTRGPGIQYVSQTSEQPMTIARGEFRSSVPAAHKGGRLDVRRESSSLGGLRGLFAAFSLDPPRQTQDPLWETRPTNERRGSSRRTIEAQLPADDLFTYLRTVDLPPWSLWPNDKDSRWSTSGLSALWTGNHKRGHDQMPWGWHRRVEAAENGRRAGRTLVSWVSTGYWERKILEWLDDNVPSEQIHPANRWGAQIFALPAPGFDTLDFYDEGAEQSDDLGLLSWLTGSVLQTAVSALHMLRFSSQEFTFHLIPSSSPAPYSSQNHALWDGIGTLALVNKADQLDRAMVIEVRPPDVCDKNVLREFAKTGRMEGWWHLPAQYAVGDAGQANLLQAQVYDSCVQNQVYYFAVTNLKHWVFGHFNANYTKCWVGDVVERKQRDPNVMQCLVAWTIRAVDERPRRSEAGESISRSRSHSRRQAEAEDPAPPTAPPRHHRRHHSHSALSQHHNERYDNDRGQTAHHNPSHMDTGPPPNGQNQMQMHQSPMGDFGQGYGMPPGYYDPHMGMSSPPPPFPGYSTWQGGMSTPQFQNSSGFNNGWYGGYGWGMR